MNSLLCYVIMIVMLSRSCSVEYHTLNENDHNIIHSINEHMTVILLSCIEACYCYGRACGCAHLRHIVVARPELASGVSFASVGQGLP